MAAGGGQQAGIKQVAESDSNFAGYAVQCDNCLKWRKIPSKEEYEAIRENILDDPWYCHMKPNVSCDDPSQVEPDDDDDGTIWAADIPNLLRPPAGTQRLLKMRPDFSRVDV
ncbi:hypothetical protein Cni_G24528 [Canna indica]|uniref:CW-type domain-containing protein n=1 Tax=Canna indica TaxID=4628 RepID=A0AAQ3KV88_9LILI|nr:hypothetical protein Cni_G24528 [Canna indica]